MPLWPLPTQAARYANQRGTGATLSQVNVATGGSAHTKGSPWTQLVASTGVDASILRLYFAGHNSSGVASPALVDIGIGSANSEIVLLPDLDVGFHAAPLNLQVPVSVPAGTRLSARAQGARTSVNIGVAADVDGEQGLAGSGVPSAAKWTAYGVDAANSRGTAHTAGNSNAWSNWASIGTTTSDHDYWFAMFDMGADTGVTSITYRIQVAVCANSTEADAMVAAGTLQADIVWATNSAEYAMYQTPHTPFARRSPTASGATIQVRASASGTARAMYIAAYGGS